MVVDQDRCCGSGMCASVAPDIFDQSPRDGVVQLLVSQVDAGSLPRVEEALRLCPVAAIELARPVSVPPR
ncbi:ferredoxin [Micromonospora luteifusca]|nr:ferredoxin [Micromonospora luteifusca]